MLPVIEQIFHDYNEIFGSSKIYAILKDRGYAQLLQDVQDEKAARYERERQQNLARIRGRNKDYYM